MSQQLIKELTQEFMKTDLPKFAAGDNVRVHVRIKEGDRERIQIFEGLVLKRQNGEGINGTFTVRKISFGVGVERTFPLHTPMIEKIEVTRYGRVRRAKLNYIRALSTKAARIKERRIDVPVVGVAQEPEPVVEAPVEAPVVEAVEATTSEE